MKKQIIIYIFLFIFTGKTFAQTFIDERIKEAEKLYCTNQFKEALYLLNDVISQNPNDMYALLDRSCVFDALNEYEKALHDIEIVIKDNPSNIKARHFRGGIYENLGEHEKAIEDENFVLNLVPDFSSGLNVRGLAYGRLGLYEKSLNDFNNAINSAFVHNEYPEIYYLNRANTYYFMKNYSESLNDLEWALHFNNINPESMLLMSKILRATGKYEESIKWVSDLISIKDDYYEAYYLRIIDYLQLKKFDNAKRDLDIIKKSSSKFSAYHALLSVYFYLTGDIDKSKSEYKLSKEIGRNEKNAFVIKLNMNDEIDDFMTSYKFEEIIFDK